MMPRRPPLIVAALAVILSLLSSLHVAADGPREVPPLNLVDGQGTPISIADLKGRVVLLDFFASWCIPCAKAFPLIDVMHKELASKGLAVVGINLDEQRKAADGFLRRFPKSTMPVAFDPQGASAQVFELKAMPSTVIVDRRGRIRFVHTGYTEKTIARYRSEVELLLGEHE